MKIKKCRKLLKRITSDKCIKWYCSSLSLFDILFQNYLPNWGDKMFLSAHAAVTCLVDLQYRTLCMENWTKGKSIINSNTVTKGSYCYVIINCIICTSTMKIITTGLMLSPLSKDWEQGLHNSTPFSLRTFYNSRITYEFNIKIYPYKISMIVQKFS